MTTDIPEITEGNRLDMLEEAVHRIDHRTAQMETELRALLNAWSVGGLRGLRQAAKGRDNGQRG